MPITRSKENLPTSTVEFENSLPLRHSRFVSRPVPETTLVEIGLLYTQPLLSRIASLNVLDFIIQ